MFYSEIFERCANEITIQILEVGQVLARFMDGSGQSGN